MLVLISFCVSMVFLDFIVVFIMFCCSVSGVFVNGIIMVVVFSVLRCVMFVVLFGICICRLLKLFSEFKGVFVD